MWSKLKERFKRKKSEEVHTDVVCLNCETKFTGNYCPNCGQAFKEYDRPFGFIIYNFLGDFFAFDTRFFKTLIALLVKPGFLTKEYFAGRRVRYAPPFRIFVFVSFLLFLLLQIYTNRGLSTVLDGDLEDAKIGLDSTSLVLADSIFSEATAELTPKEEMVVDSIKNKYLNKTDTISAGNLFNYMDLESLKNKRDLRKTLNTYADKLEVDLEKETNPEEQAEIRELIRLCRSPESALAKILKYISYAFFLLLPIFAILMKLIYIRRKQNYMRHLVFSIHIHSFIFLVLTLILAMFSFIDGGNMLKIASYTFLLIPLYLVVAMKKVYGQSVLKVIVKFFVVSFLYNIIFWFLIIMASLNAINLV